MAWSNSWNIPTEAPANELSITIPIEGGWPRTINAVICGDLAVHSDLKIKDGEAWQITHVPTLARFNCTPPGLFTKRELIAWATRVQSEHLDAWALIRQLSPDRYKTIGAQLTEEEKLAKDEIEGYCLSVEI